jgi:hypothetical protein
MCFPFLACATQHNGSLSLRLHADSQVDVEAKVHVRFIGEGGVLVAPQGISTNGLVIAVGASMILVIAVGASVVLVIAVGASVVLVIAVGASVVLGSC